ncbi:MAG: hypothetical protein ABIP65_05585, partial [Vicinamibacterales bacterium]
MKPVLRDTPIVHRATAPRHDPPPTDEIDLAAYVRLWWRSRYVLLAVGLTAAVTTYLINRQIAPTYEVEFRLMISEPRIAGELPSEVRTVAYRALVESPTQAAALLREFSLDRPPHNLTPQRFLADHVFVEVIRDSAILRVTVRLKDADVLLKLSQRYADRVIEEARRLATEGTDYTTERIRLERDGTAKRLERAEQALQTARRTTQIELLRTDVDTMLARRPEALDLTVEIQGERAR